MAKFKVRLVAEVIVEAGDQRAAEASLGVLKEHLRRELDLRVSMGRVKEPSVSLQAMLT